MNEASRWRLAIAERLAEFYEQLPGLAGVLVVSSTARGHADRFSDLDLIVIWYRPITESERQSVITEAGADLVYLYPYDKEWGSWSDIYMIGRDQSGQSQTGLTVDVTHYLATTPIEMLRDVTDNFATDEPGHNLAALVSYGRPLKGEQLLRDFQANLDYPEGLATAIVTKYGQIEFFWRWRSSLERGHNLMLMYQNFVSISQQLLRTLLALNRVYFIGFGRLDLLLEQLEIAPVDFADRFRSLWDLEPQAMAEELRALIEETYDLVDQHLPEVDVERLRRLFHYERPLWSQPPAGLFPSPDRE